MNRAIQSGYHNPSSVLIIIGKHRVATKNIKTSDSATVRSTNVNSTSFNLSDLCHMENPQRVAPVCQTPLTLAAI